jgi:hypothetical protein
MERMPSRMPAGVPERMECSVGGKIASPREGCRIYRNVSEVSVVRERMGAGRYVTDGRVVS